MKKIQLLLAGAAVCAAGLGVYANAKGLATQYFITTTMGVATCSTVYTGIVCPAGTSTQCTVAINETTTRWVTKRIDGAACELHRKTN